MLKTLERHSVVRAAHSSWPADCDASSRYDGCVTMDPARASRAWSILSEDTFPAEIANYPAMLHRAFMMEIAKRSKDD